MIVVFSPTCCTFTSAYLLDLKIGQILQRFMLFLSKSWDVLAIWARPLWTWISPWTFPHLSATFLPLNKVYTKQIWLRAMNSKKETNLMAKFWNTYTLNINTRLILSVIIFISMFYYFSFPSNSMSMCSINVRCLESLCRILHFVDLHSAIWRGLPKSKNKFRSFVILFYEVSFWILHIIFKCRD